MTMRAVSQEEFDAAIVHGTMDSDLVGTTFVLMPNGEIVTINPKGEKIITRMVFAKPEGGWNER